MNCVVLESRIFPAGKTAFMIYIYIHQSIELELWVMSVSSCCSYLAFRQQSKIFINVLIGFTGKRTLRRGIKLIQWCHVNSENLQFHVSFISSFAVRTLLHRPSITNFQCVIWTRDMHAKQTWYRWIFFSQIAANNRNTRTRVRCSAAQCSNVSKVVNGHACSLKIYFHIATIYHIDVVYRFPTSSSTTRPGRLYSVSKC